MRRAFKILGPLLLNIFLVLIAVFLIQLLLIPSVIFAIIISFFKKKIGEGLKSMSIYFRAVSISIDQLGNVVCKDLFNLLLRDSKGHKFGNPDETISSVLGKNKLNNTLTYTGKILSSILDFLDKNHSVNSIE